jgi:phage-related minor tail protein
MNEVEKKAQSIVEIQGQMKAGVVSEAMGKAQILKLTSDISKINEEEAKKNNRGAVSEAGKQATYEVGLYEKLNDAYIKTAQSYKGYNDIQLKVLDAFDDPRFKKMSDNEKVLFREHVERLLESADAEKKLTETEKESNKIREETVKLRNQQVEVMRTLQKETENAIKAAQSDTQSFAFEVSLVGKSDQEKERLRNEFEYKKKISSATDAFENASIKARSQFSEQALEEELIRLGVLYEERVKLANMAKDHQLRLSEDVFIKTMAQDEIFKQSFSQMGDAIVEFARTGEFEFGNMIENMIAELAKLELKMQMMKFYESMGGGSEGGILGTLFSAFTGVTQAKGGAWQNGVQMFAKGGVVNRTTAFGMQGGFGVMGEAGPEAIMPLKRGRDGSMGVVSSGGSSVQVVINNLSGSPVSQKEEVDSRGNRRVEVTVGEMVAGETQRNGSMMQRSIGNTFGTRPQLIAR